MWHCFGHIDPTGGAYGGDGEGVEFVVGGNECGGEDSGGKQVVKVVVQAGIRSGHGHQEEERKKGKKTEG